MLKIRLMRIGTNKKPFYRVVAVDERAKRTGAYVELLGTYNPLTEPKEIKLKQERIDYWIKQGAQMSDGFLRIIGKAPQRPPRKPKKTREQGAGDSEQLKTKKTEEKIETEKTNSEPEEEKVEEEKAAASAESSGPLRQSDSEASEPKEEKKEEIVTEEPVKPEEESDERPA